MSGELGEVLPPEVSVFFPGKENEPQPLIEGIHVIRQTNTGPVYSPRLFHPSQLPDLQALQNLFGGGSYVLQGRAYGRIMGHFKVSLDGESKSLSGEAPRPLAAQPIAQGGENSSIMAMFLQMMQQNAQMQMQMQMETSKQNTQMTLAMMQRSDAQQATMLAVMAEASKTAQQSQADFFRYLSEMRGKDQGAGGNLAAFREGMDLGTTITDIVKTQGDSDGGLGSTIGAIMQGMQALKSDAPAAAPAMISVTPTGE